MDFLRTRVLGRGDSSNGQDTDLEQRGAPDVGHDQEQEQAGRRQFGSDRYQLPSIMPSQSRGIRRLQRRNTNRDDDGPKTPRFHIGLPSLPSARFHLPGISRTSSRDGSTRSSSEMSVPSATGGPEPRASLQQSRGERLPTVAEPQATHIRPESRSSSRTRRFFRGADPAEMHLAGLAEDGRRRRRQRNGSDQAQAEGKPKRFLYCFPWIRSWRIRKQILRCFVSGMFLLLMLAIYLALSATKNISNSEFTIILILIILFTTIVFCHSLIRLCMLIVKPEALDDEERRRLPEMLGPGGYAVPRRPIRVLLARDEEAAGLESDTTKVQPPAYGLWRESVRVDPNRIYWQRNDQPPTIEEESVSRPATATRPPSYASDDGVEYVVEARPRSMAPGSMVIPASDVPMPTHPSEVGRVAQHSSF